MAKREEEFIKALTEFYGLFLGNVSRAILKLAEIQKKYKDEYNSLKELQTDPSKIEKYLDNLTDEQRGFLLRLFVKMARFEARLSRLFELSVKEKRELAKEIEEFSEEIKKRQWKKK